MRTAIRPASNRPSARDLTSLRRRNCLIVQRRSKGRCERPGCHRQADEVDHVYRRGAILSPPLCECPELLACATARLAVRFPSLVPLVTMSEHDHPIDIARACERELKASGLWEQI